MLDRRCQRFLLIRKKEPYLMPQCRNRDRGNVVDADDGVFIEPVTHTYWNFGRQPRTVPVIGATATLAVR